MNKKNLYVASNVALPGYLKIGFCSGSVEKRLKQLSNTSVPFDFNCEYQALISNASHAESVIHNILSPYRVNQSREFFVVDLSTVINLIKLIESDKHEKIKSQNKREVKYNMEDDLTLTDCSKIIKQGTSESAEVLDSNAILHQGRLFNFYGFINHLKSKGENLESWIMGEHRLIDFIV